MIFLRTLTACILAALCTANASAENRVHRCSSDMATGILKNAQTGRWEEGAFQLVEFTIAGALDAASFEMKLTHPASDTTLECNQLPRTNSIGCQTSLVESGIGNTFMLDLDSSRFILVYTGVFSFLLGDETSILYAGTCDT